MKWKLTTMAMLSAGMLVLGGCAVEEAGGASREPSEKKGVEEISIGFAQQTLSAPYYVAMNEEMERLAKERGFALTTVAADRDVDTQIQQIEDLTARGVDALIINAIEPTTEKQAVLSASSQTHIIFIDTSIPDAGQVTDILADNVRIGQEAGKMAGARLPEGEPIELAILNGGPRDSIVGPQRREGFLAGLDEAGVEYEIVGEANGEYAQDTAVQAAEDLLAANPGTDLIFGYNDAMALGALQVLRTLGNTSALVAGIDGQKEAFKEISEGGCTGQYVSTGLNSPSLAAEQAVNAAIQVATGEKAPADFEKQTFTEAVGIDCNNIAEYYDPASTF